MRIFITGSNGFLAQKFCEVVLDKGLDISLFGVSKSISRNPFLTEAEFQQLDVTDFELLEASLTRFKPTHILHTAAAATVESCDADKEAADKINIELTSFLASYSALNAIHLTFLSTDFVFDGLGGPYREDAETNPLNYYGETKVLAEQVLLHSEVEVAILRTILVYGAIPDSGRSNLVLWAKGQLEQGKPIKVVSDQWRMPTWVDDLAEACFIVMQKRITGLYHISGEEMMSIEEAVRKLAEVWQLDQSLISPITAKELGQEFNRPKRTGFDISKAKADFDFKPTFYVDSLVYICEQLKKYGR